MDELSFYKGFMVGGLFSWTIGTLIFYICKKTIHITLKVQNPVSREEAERAIRELKKEIGL